jgi:hypothetical protein
MAIVCTAANVRPIGKYISCRVVSNATITAGQVVYHNGTGLTQADGDAAGTANCMGIALQGGSSGDYLDVLIQGRVTGWAGLTAGKIEYVSDEAGEVVETHGTATFGVGWAVSTSDIYVNPQKTVA